MNRRKVLTTGLALVLAIGSTASKGVEAIPPKPIDALEEFNNSLDSLQVRVESLIKTKKYGKE